MQLVPVLILPADLPVEEASRRLGALPDPVVDSHLVVVRREDVRPTRFYAFSTALVRETVARRSGIDLLVALDLHEWQASPVVAPGAVPGAVRTPTVVLDGATVLGVAVPDRQGGGSRGVQFGSGGRPRPTRGPRPPAPSLAPPPLAPSPALPPPAAGPRKTVPGPPGPPGPPTLFRAFPHLDAPPAVVVAEVFTLIVGLTRTSAADLPPGTPPILIPGAPDPVPLTVQVTGFGFTFPAGIRRELAVPLHDVEGVTVAFPVVADPVRSDVVRVLEVSFEYAGNLCGQAWREVQVSAAPAAAPARIPLAGGTGVVLPPLESTPDLTIEIHSRQGHGELEWIFHARDPDLGGPGRR